MLKSCQILRRPFVVLLRHRYFCSLSSLESDDGTNHSPDALQTFRQKVRDGPHLKDFIRDEDLMDADHVPEGQLIPYLKPKNLYGDGRRVFLDVYGCQMNVNDTEIIWSILKRHNYVRTLDERDANIILIVTCAIRDGAESKIWTRLRHFRRMDKMGYTKRKKIGILGCMAERLKEKVLEIDGSVDLVAGPDSYRDLPRLLTQTDSSQKSINVLLSLDETYADIMPVRLNEDAATAFVSIMRGCDNMCTYCIVPFTRGRERSRPLDSILKEVRQLSEQGVKEVTLLGQNVNSYRDITNCPPTNKTDPTKLSSSGFKTVYRPKMGGVRFAELLDKVAGIDPNMRVRFTSPHPKDFPDDVLYVIQSHTNICKNLHMPAQSGSTAVLERMRRGYSRETYLELIENVRRILPDCAISSDFICGFCDESDAEFFDTVTLVETVRYNCGYFFMYSMREKTTAHRRYVDNVTREVKGQRVLQLTDTYRTIANQLNRTQIGRTHLILLEGASRRSDKQWMGRNDHNIKVVIPKVENVPNIDGVNGRELKIGDYVAVEINEANSQILKGIPLYYTNLVEFHENLAKQPPIREFYRQPVGLLA